MISTAAFSTDGESALHTKVTVTSHQTMQDNLGTVYELEKCSTWIRDRGFKMVALQLPDCLLCDTVAITSQLQAAVPDGVQVYVLGDTSYGSCCVDEVAAQHHNSDCIIHFGHSCLSVPGTMPVLYVFGQQPLDVADCVGQFSTLLPDTEANTILVYDTVYAYACDSIMETLKTRYRNLICSRLLLPLDRRDSPVETSIGDSKSDTDGTCHTMCGRRVTLPKSKTLDYYSIFYIGSESLTLTNMMYNFKPCQFYSYNPCTKVGRKETVNVNRALMKRYYLIEKAKDARIVGILIGTLGVANYLDILNRLKLLIKKAGKKSYVFIVGKINVAKLANFMEIDIFVLIACAENSLLDSSEFYKPVITPYELELACNPDREWTTKYPTDFSTLLEGGSHHVPIPETIDQGDGTDISLITGKLRHIGEVSDPVETGTAVVLRNDNMALATPADTAGEYLGGRSWQGLEVNLGKTPVTRAVEGQMGVAAGYTSEPSTKTS